MNQAPLVIGLVSRRFTINTLLISPTLLFCVVAGIGYVAIVPSIYPQAL